MKFLLFLLAVFSIHASVNEPLRWEFFSGYRNDRIHWYLQNPDSDAASYSELYRDLQFWENGLTFKVIHQDIAFFIRGSYSAFARGTLFQHYFNLSFTADQPQFTAPTSGWAADASGYVSYTVNLTNGRHYKWIVMPLLGYSGHFELLHRFQVHPNPLATSSYSLTSSFPQALRQSWYGVFLGGGLQIEPGGRFIFNLGYTYHWLRTHFKTSWEDSALLAGGSSVTQSNKLHINHGGNLGQTGWAQLDSCFANLWRIGFGAQIHYFSTTFVSLDLKQNGVSVPQTLKLRWTPIDGWVQISREF